MATMAFYMQTIQKPYLVNGCASGYFISPTEEHLIMVKNTILEVHQLDNDNLVFLKDFQLYGQIVFIKTIRLKDRELDYFVVVTNRCNLLILKLVIIEGILNIATVASGNLGSRLWRQTTEKVHVVFSTDFNILICNLYRLLIHVIYLDRSEMRVTTLRLPFNIGISAMDILYGRTEDPVLVFIANDNGDEDDNVVVYPPNKGPVDKNTIDSKIFACKLELRWKELETLDWANEISSIRAHIIIPVPLPFGGFVLIGNKLIYHDGERIRSTSDFPAQHVVEEIHYMQKKLGSNLSYLIATNESCLYSLSFIAEEVSGVAQFKELKIEMIGPITIPSCITMLHTRIFIGSMSSKSVLYKLDEDKLSPINESNQEKINNISLIEEENCLLACASVNYEDGIVKTTYGLPVHSNITISLPGIKRLWIIDNNHDNCDKLLVLSFLHSTKILSLSGEDVEEIDIANFISDNETLYCGDAVHAQFVQVTKCSVRLFASETRTLVNKWIPPINHQSINIAAGNLQQIVVACKCELFYLKIELCKFCLMRCFKFDTEIACLDVTPQSNNTYSEYIVVGFWLSNSVRILTTANLEEITSKTLSDEFVPRSIIMTPNNELFICLANGELQHFGIIENKLVRKTSKKISSTASSLQLLHCNGIYNVFACNKFPSIIQLDCGVIRSINQHNLVAAVFLNTQVFPNSILFASIDGLIIGQLSDRLESKTVHVDFQYHPIAIAYQKETETFGILVHLESGCALIIMDRDMSKILSQAKMADNQLAVDLISCRLSNDSNNYYVMLSNAVEEDGIKCYFYVSLWKNNRLTTKGTYYEERKFCERLVEHRGYLLTTTGGEVVALKLNEQYVLNTAFRMKLDQYITDLISNGDFFATADILCGVRVYKYFEGRIFNQRFEICGTRRNAMSHVLALSHFDDSCFICSDHASNLYIMKINPDEQKIISKESPEMPDMEEVAKIHLGDCIQKFVKGSLNSLNAEKDSSSKDGGVFGVSYETGAIILVKQIPIDQYKTLLNLQNKLEKVLKNIGNLSHSRWRTLDGYEESENVIDGDFIARFCELTEKQQLEMIKDTKMELKEIIEMIDQLQNTT